MIKLPPPPARSIEVNTAEAVVGFIRKDFISVLDRCSPALNHRNWFTQYDAISGRETSSVQVKVKSRTFNQSLKLDGLKTIIKVKLNNIISNETKVFELNDASTVKASVETRNIIGLNVFPAPVLKKARSSPTSSKNLSVKPFKKPSLSPKPF
jgi:hypothetical protein